jgi:hypothetical protein
LTAAAHRCLNIGEVGTVTLGLDWTEFEDGLKDTNVTHAYISDRLHGPTDSHWKVAKRHLAANRKKDRRHLYEHDVIDAAIRLWFTPKSSGLYQTVFRPLSYDDAKKLAHDAGKIRELYNPNYKKRRRVTWNLVDPEDRTFVYCGFCWDGGDLLLCDGMGADGKGCPEVLHAECSSVAPQDGQPFLCESCRLLHHLDPTRFSFRDGWQSDQADYGGEEFEVECILDCAIDSDPKTGRQKKLYLTKWKGYSAEHNTWEPRENLSSCPLIWEAFLRRCPGMSSNSLEKGAHSGTRVKVNGKKRLPAADATGACADVSTAAAAPSDAQTLRPQVAPQLPRHSAPVAPGEKKTRAQPLQPAIAPPRTSAPVAPGEKKTQPLQPASTPPRQSAREKRPSVRLNGYQLQP